MATIASTANSSLHQLQTFNSDSIFCPYLNSNEGTFVEKPPESSQNLNPFISNRKDPLHQGEKKEEDGEIGVFGAEKYFNGGEVETSRAANIAARKYQHQREEQIALETRPYKVRYGTPSIRSESTSNSQIALLESAMRNSSRHRKNKAQAKSFLAGLGIKCSCSDKNSVDISDHAGEISFNKTATYGVAHGKTTPKKIFDLGLDANHSVRINKPRAELLINKDAYFQKPEKLGVGLSREKNSLAFSPVNSGLGNHMFKMQLQLEEEEKPRKPLAVFGSPVLSNKTKSLSFDKRLTMPSKDAAPKVEEIDISANSGSNYNDDASDASSDLFEIESLKGKSNPFLARQTSDAASSCVSPTTCYAPSEASIEWSVVTASAAVMSDCEEQMSEVTIRSPIRRTPFSSSNGKAKAGREIQRPRPSMLLGCKSHKAVRVAGDAFITYEKPSSSPQIRHRTNTSQVTRFPGETKLGTFGGRNGQHAYATPLPLQRCHSSDASQLYTWH